MLTVWSKAVSAVRSGGALALSYWFLYKCGMRLEGLGRLAQQLGNRARIDGNVIDVSNEHIDCGLKGQLVLGRYECPERQLVLRHLPTAEPVIELGASIGVMACTVNRRLVAPNQHVVLEAHPGLISTLERNRRLNRCQFRIVHAALAYDKPSVNFYLNEGSLLGSVHHQRGVAVTVSTRRLGSVARDVGFDRFTLICDIEGGEIDLLNHELPLLRQRVGLIVVEFHPSLYGQEHAETALALLRDAGFQLIDHAENTFCLRNSLIAARA
jgi:FkbM family methyltransferase